MSHVNLFDWNPRLQRTGYWSPVTASINWCEEDYKYSHYVAEFYNTITNGVLLGLAMLAFQKAKQEKLPLRHKLMDIALMTIATGSLFFHATLKWSWQLADELPMLFATTINLYIILETSPKGVKPYGGALLPFFMAFTLVTVSLVYIMHGNPVLHQVVYAISLLAGVIRTEYLLYTRLDQTLYDFKRRREIRKICGWGTVSFLLAFFVWNLDNLYCSNSQKYKDRYGFPLEAAFEGHAWWHVGTGIGGLYLAQGTQILARSLAEGTEAFEVKWTLGLPWLKRESLQKSKTT